MNTTKLENHGAVAGQVERGVRPLVDERGPLSTLRFELRKVLAACASERCAPEIGAKLDALLDAPQWDAAAATYHDFRRECNDTDAVLHVLGLDPVNCRTDGGSLKLVMLLGALEHRDVMLKREARQVTKGLTVQADADGVWLNFAASTGLHALLNVERIADSHGGIVSKALRDWVADVGKPRGA